MKFQFRGEHAGRHGMSLAEAAAIAAAVPVLAWPAFLNGFPLVFADTGTYLGQARLFYLGWDRPPFYSFFLRAVDGGLSLWIPVFVQGAIVAHLVFLTLRSLGRPAAWATLLACVALSAGTSLAWVVSELIADVFTGVAVLALWLLGFGSVGRWERLYLVLLATGAIAVHVSHVPVALGLVVVGGALAWHSSGLRTALRAAGRMVLPAVLAVAAILLVNLAGHGVPSLSPYGSVIYVARLIGDGQARAYLREACPTRHYAICAHLDQLGDGGSDFLWNRLPHIPELGGAKGWTPEAKEIVRGTIAHDPDGVALAALKNAARQFVFLHIGHGLQPWLGEPGPEPLIARFFPWELAAYKQSAQSTGKLKVQSDAIAPVLSAASWVGLAGLVAVAVARRRHQPALALCVLVLAAALGNAFATGALSGVESRYQARIAWLFALAPAAALAARPATQAGTRSAERATAVG